MNIKHNENFGFCNISEAESEMFKFFVLYVQVDV